MFAHEVYVACLTNLGLGGGSLTVSLVLATCPGVGLIAQRHDFGRLFANMAQDSALALTWPERR